MTFPRQAVMKTIPALLASLFLHGMPALAQQSSPAPRDAELEKQLADTKAKILMLQQRIESLEKRLGAMAMMPASPPAAQGMPQRQAPAAGAAGTPPPAAQTAAARPGSFEIDEEAAQRALERTLTQSGALLLPQGAITVTPSFGYARTEISAGLLGNAVNPSTGATFPVLGTQTLRRNEFTGRVDLRMGMPMQTQLELGLPYQYVRSSRIDSFGGDFTANGSGFGDLSIGLAKTLVREKGIMPDVIGRLTYITGSGSRTDGQVALAGGYRQLGGEVVALKRQDPLAFFASASYGHVFEKNGLRPGDVASLSIGTVLAASPATSLQLGFTQTYRQKMESGGIKLPGTDQTYGIVGLGASAVLSRDVMLLVSTGIGLGGDAPKYSFNVSLPITFR